MFLFAFIYSCSYGSQSRPLLSKSIGSPLATSGSDEKKSEEDLDQMKTKVKKTGQEINRAGKEAETKNTET